MPIFEWDKDFEVTVETFNEQHRYLVSLINNLYNEMKAGKGSAYMEKLLDELVVYAASHFQNEEEMMDKHQFPELEIHRNEHENFKSRLKELCKNYYNKKSKLEIETFQFLKNWLSRHILGLDQKYSEFFRGKL
ncbi:MAG: hypothetical protein A2096_15920 [Spirochaetes bacterium GWF1_41_5]|nr:MAG: hypothetical protein A2096_15920 [Spirochaetes bacterium GWF1_41_5]HBE03794.1 hemerythrin [Spirochaetia bacterium]